MKKLISLLSVLTITGTAMPNVIAASNYEKQENTENLKRNKREDKDNCTKFYVSSKVIDLLEKKWKDTEREFKKVTFVNIDTVRNNITIDKEIGKEIEIDRKGEKGDIFFKNPFNYKALLKNLMISFLENVLIKKYSSHPYTNPEFINAINNIKRIDKGKFLITLNKDLKLDNIFLNKNDKIVINFKPSKSLKKSENNVMPLEKVIKYSDLGKIKDNKPETIIQTILDKNPNSGVNKYDLKLDENFIFKNVAYVRSKNPNFSDGVFVLFSTKEKEEKRDDILIKCSINVENDSDVLNDAFIESSLDNSLIEVDNEEQPFYYEEDYFEKWYRVDQDGLQLKLSYITASRLILFSQTHEIKELKKYLKELIKNVKKINNTGADGYISESDLDLMVDFICDGYLKLHEKVLNWSKYLYDDKNKDGDKYSIFIRTWVGYNWKDLSQEYQDSAFYISKDSKYNNWENYSTV